MDFLESTHVWYAVSFAMFAAIVWKYGKPALLGFIDNRIEEIRTELETAENLRTEAHELLAQYQRKHKDAVKDADAIVQNAQKQADAIMLEAEKDLDATFKRREKQLEERLKRMEQAATEEIRQYAANLAMNATAEIIAEQLDKKSNDKLVDAAIEEIGKNIH